MKHIIQKSLIVLAFGLAILPSEAQSVRRERIRRDQREDVRDRREDMRDRREDVRDRREDIRDAQHQGGPLDRMEDRRDRREDVRDRREDVRDRREDRRDRRRRGYYSTAQQHPQPQVQVRFRVGTRHAYSHGRIHRGPRCGRNLHHQRRPICYPPHRIHCRR